MSTITIERTRNPKPARAANETPAFGTVFTDHMCLIDYKEGKGWHNPRIVPYSGLPTEPASTVLHYGQAIFDGLKGFRGKDGVIRLFRPKAHAERLNRSAEQLCIPRSMPNLSPRPSPSSSMSIATGFLPPPAPRSTCARP